MKISVTDLSKHLKQLTTHNISKAVDTNTRNKQKRI